MIHKHLYKRLAEKMATSWRIFFLAFLALLIMAVILSFFPILVQQVLYAAFIEKNSTTIQASLLTITLLLIIFSLADYSCYYMLRKAGNRLRMQLNSALFNKLLNLPAQHYQNLDEHQVTDIALTSIKQISQSTVQMIATLVRNMLIIIGLLLCLFWFDRDFASLVLLLIPFAIIMSQVMQGQQNASLQTNSPAFNKLANHLQQSIRNFRQIRLYGGQYQECQHLKKEAQSIQENESQQINYKIFVASLCQLIMLLIVVAIFYLLIQQVLSGHFTLDQVGAFIMAILLLIIPVNRLAGVSQILQNEQKHLEQIFSLLDLNTISDHGTQALCKVTGKLTFEHVCFFSSESGKSIPNQIDLEIHPGETIVIVCKDKHIRSLLIDLMLGFYQPVTGKMLLDTVPFTEIKHPDLLAQFAMVSNEPVILSDEVAGNIAYGATRCAHEASITAVTQTSQASKFVREMPNGLQTHVDKNGAGITREQWQKIAIARALLKNAPILIMDNLWFQSLEQTSFNMALAKLIQNRTTVILMQTIPAIRRHIDHVYFLEEGVLIQK